MVRWTDIFLKLYDIASGSYKAWIHLSQSSSWRRARQALTHRLIMPDLMDHWSKTSFSSLLLVSGLTSEALFDICYSPHFASLINSAFNHSTSISKSIICPAHYFPAPTPGISGCEARHLTLLGLLCPWEPAADNTCDIQNPPSLFKPPTWVAQSAESRQMWVMLRIVR